MVTAVPPEPKKRSVRLQQTGEWIRITYAKREWASAWFLLFWLTGWTFGCIMIAGVVLFDFQWVKLLFALPFWAAELFVAGLVGTMIANREVLSLDAQGVTYRRTIWRIPISRRQIPLSEITEFSTRYHEVYTNDDGERTKSSMQSKQVIEAHTVGRTLTGFGGIATDEAHWLVHLLNEQLDLLKRLYAPTSQTSDEASSAELLKPESLPPVLELRPPSTTEVKPPSDTGWSYHFDFDAITFTQRGRITLAGLGGVLFVCVFWNSIVGVFVAGLCGLMPGEANGGMPKGFDWWVLFFFLIPFELIGLVFFVALLGALLEPVRRSRWIFARNEVRYRISWLGIGRTWRYEIRELDRLELRKDDAEESDEDETTTSEGEESEPNSTAKQKSLGDVIKKVKQRRKGGIKVETGELDQASFALALVDRQGTDVCTIDSLSLGEACWFADVILRERSGWFA